MDIYVRIRPVPKVSNRVIVEHSENKLEFNIPRDAAQVGVPSELEILCGQPGREKHIKVHREMAIGPAQCNPQKTLPLFSPLNAPELRAAAMPLDNHACTYFGPANKNSKLRG